MKSINMPAICALIVLLLFTAAFINKSAPSKVRETHHNNINGFAVLELFTSEGCSSCPDADALLARVQKQAGNKPVYVLAFHVDYWNRLGWKDGFSDARYSRRQYQYSRLLGTQVYTPQVVINGQSECVGSDEPAINSAIKEALNTTEAVSLSIRGRQSAASIHLDYKVTGNAGNNQLVIALVQKQAVSQVTKGENEGRTLAHAQIVRDLYTIDLPRANAGTLLVKLPDAFNTRDWELIGLVQNAVSGKITAATRVSIANAQDPY